MTPQRGLYALLVLFLRSAALRPELDLVDEAILGLGTSPMPSGSIQQADLDCWSASSPSMVCKETSDCGSSGSEPCRDFQCSRCSTGCSNLHEVKACCMESSSCTGFYGSGAHWWTFHSTCVEVPHSKNYAVYMRCHRCGLGPAGASACDPGAASPPEVRCEAAGISATREQGIAPRHYKAGQWSHLPPGCSVLSSSGASQWVIHYNHRAGGKNDGRWSPICCPEVPAPSVIGSPEATGNPTLNVLASEEGATTEGQQGVPGSHAPAPFSYDFAKPACEDAEPQAPRDLSPGAAGHKVPKAAVLSRAEAAFLPLTNVHYHLGAEHKSDAFSNDTDSVAYDGSSPSLLQASGHVRPGFMCPVVDVAPENLTAYKFQYCTGDIAVGKTYEVHWVHSSAGYTAEEADRANVDAVDDGLGGAANGRGLLNPMVVVNAQVFQIVQGARYISDMLHRWTVDHSSSVMYAGSTTGTSYDNAVCSPYSITWHVDLRCHRVSPECFDNFCKQAQEMYNLVSDLAPHGSRVLVDPRWVVKEAFVVPLA